MRQVELWRLLAPSELASIQGALAQRLAAWQQDCFPARETLRCTVHAAVDADLRLDQPDFRLGLLNASGRVIARLDCEQSLLDWLQEQAGFATMQQVRAGQRSSLARRACLNLLRELLARLAGLPMGSAAAQSLFSEENPILPLAHGCGAVRLELKAPAGMPAPRLQVLLSHCVVAQWCRPRPSARGGLSSRQGLANGLSLRYRVLAGSVELPVSSLAQLQPGDVLRLDTRADHGLLLHARNGLALARVGIGLLDRQAALQICAD